MSRWKLLKTTFFAVALAGLLCRCAAEGADARNVDQAPAPAPEPTPAAQPAPGAAGSLAGDSDFAFGAPQQCLLE